MVPRPRPQAARTAKNERGLSCDRVTTSTPAGVRFPSAGLALLAAAVALAVACSGSRTGNGDLVDVDVAGVSVDASPAPGSDPDDPADPGDPPPDDPADPGDPPPDDPADPGDPPPDDGSNDRPDPASSGTVAVEGSAAPEANDGTEAPGVAVVEEDGTADTGSGASESGVAESGASESGVAENGADENGAVESGAAVVAPPENSGTIGIPVPATVLNGPRAPLTGELIGDPTLAQRRAVAVKVGNGDRRDRPQAGLAAADIVYETLIEGGESRLLAVFHSEIPDRVGPVRSVRTSDFDLLVDLSRPYLASSGANVTVLSEIRRADREGTIVDVGGMRTFVPYSRDPDRRSPHNLYFHSENLTDEDGAALWGGSLEEPVVPLLDYGSSNPAGIAGANGVTVSYHRPSDNVVSHIWDASVGGWVRIQDGDLMMTETDFGLREVAPVNVAVVWMTHRLAPADAESPLTKSYGTGKALVLTAGAVHEAFWERTEDRAGFRFIDTAGNPLSFSPGSTWLLIANSSRRFAVTGAEVLAADDGVRLLAEAREAAEAMDAS